MIEIYIYRNFLQDNVGKKNGNKERQRRQGQAKISTRLLPKPVYITLIILILTIFQYPLHLDKDFMIFFSGYWHIQKWRKGQKHSKRYLYQIYLLQQ